MPTPIYQPSPQKEPAKADLRGGMSIHDCALKHNLSEKTVRRYLKEVEDEKAGIKQVPNTPGGKSQTEGGQVATITVAKPAAVVFTLGNQTILLDPGDIYESFLLYEEIKVKYHLEESFSTVLHDGMGLLNEVLINPPDKPQEEGPMEVNDGSGIGYGKEEPGAQIAG
jgi:transposase